MKFYDYIGYAESAERPEDSGKYEDIITERKLYGEVKRNTRALREGETVNSDLSIGNRFEVKADAYALENFDAIRYIVWKGRRWLVATVEFDAPATLTITPGGVYNGPTPGSPESSDENSGDDSGDED